MPIIDAAAVYLEMGLCASVTDEEAAVVQQAIRRAESAIVRHLKYDPVQRERTEYYPQLDHDHQSGQSGVWEVEGSTAFWRRVSNAASAELQLRHVPVRSITSLAIDQDGRFDTRSGAFGSETLKTEGDDFWPVYDGVDDDGNRFCSDGVLRSIGRWSVVPGSVKIVYVAGFSDDEFLGNTNALNAHAIWETALIEAVRRAQKMFHLNKKTKVGHIGGLSNESLGDYSYGRDGAIMGKLFGGNADLLPESVERLHDFINYGYQIAG